ncbi:uncharacterized protein LOC131006172 [Salvia miltiorrhiza]|uniref:uncharacterized protein LOC130988513 n=2 Tax=Salvia miltiorrhiza TaxID=226208 RepID=UPI0025ABB47A|nr:uncharacterized protein LOC130988513 [Salvia miltiorrhiza]XP_057775075.1 uncharacterized protein LOC130994056 [Salvia miltiorrhiza]XP_057789330.1 uncharacterized protein LOC131006172 [Salvia miltiorrhiza]
MAFPILNLSRTSLKTFVFTALVNMSANCSSDRMKGSSMIPLSSFSLMKCRSISTCLVLSCCTGFSDILIAALLSQKSRLPLLGGKPISVSNLRSHRISVIPLFTPLNSASALDRATTFCFLLLHVTKFPPTKIPDNSQSCLHMLLLGFVHKLTYYSNCICDVGPCMGEIDEFPNKALVYTRVAQFLQVSQGHTFFVSGRFPFSTLKSQFQGSTSEIQGLSFQIPGTSFSSGLLSLQHRLL